MKKILAAIVVVYFLCVRPSFAQETIKVEITPQPCANRAGCPVDLVPVYEARGEACVTDIATFANNPTSNHYWIEDPEITTQGKANERARQFIYWTLATRSLDDSPVLKNIWKLTSGITYFLVLFVAAIMGLGLVVGQRMRFETKVKVWPTITKIAAILLYIAFSAAVIILLIQFSEILMKFFLESLGGKDFFNIYFSTDSADQINIQGAGAGNPGGAATGSSESNYISFIGCRDLNIRVQEGVRAEMFLFKATNITYYVMGTMLLLRKVILWFLLFVAPLAAILIPFVFIRNVAWIWLGVFFQWLFYGPLFALFLGAIATVWKQGIPFLFDFSRVDKLTGYVYPTAINITYGGPAQKLSALNNGNYVDTFAEYVITLIMLWAAIILPWWLLRIFRDYCCEYLMAMKNILLNMYDQMRVSGGPIAPSPTQPSPSRISQSQTINSSTYNQAPQQKTFETIEQIRHTETKQILKTVNVQASNLTDIAKFETNKNVQQTAVKNLEYLKNPMKAETPIERQKYMNIRTELLNRAVKDDKLAKQILSSVSSSVTDQRESKQIIANQVYNAVSAATPIQAVRENIARQVISTSSNTQYDRMVKQEGYNNQTVVKTVMDSTPTDRMVSVHSQIPQANISQITNSISQSVMNNASTLNQVAQKTSVPTSVVTQIFQTWNSNLTQNPSTIVQNIASNQSISKSLQNVVQTNQNISQISKNTNVDSSAVKNVVETYNTVSSSQTTTAPSPQQVIERVSQTSQVEQQKVTAILTQAAAAPVSQETINQISTTTNTSVETVQSVIQTAKSEQKTQQTTSITQQEVIDRVVEKTQVEREKVREILSQAQQAPVSQETINQISTSTNTSAQTVQNVIQTSKSVSNVQQVRQSPSATQIIQHVAEVTKLEREKVREILIQATQAPAITQQTISDISTRTSVATTTIEQVIRTAQNYTKAPPVQNEKQVIDQVATTTKIDREKVSTIVKEISNLKQEKVREIIREVHDQVHKNKDLIHEIAKQNNVKEEEVAKIAEAQEAIVAEAPQQASVEQKITIPASVSIEDYEAVKKMWQKQYESGEIPANENMQTREEWVNHDIVFITNTLNKLTSEDEAVRQQGLDDIAYILPIFMINNFKGEEMLVYLKAKLEAAKQIQEQLIREEELREKIKGETEEDEVEVSRPKSEEQAKEMEMSQSMTIDGDENGDHSNGDGEGTDSSGSNSGEPTQGM